MHPIRFYPKDTRAAQMLTLPRIPCAVLPDFFSLIQSTHLFYDCYSSLPAIVRSYGLLLLWDWWVPRQASIQDRPMMRCHLSVPLC